MRLGDDPRKLMIAGVAGRQPGSDVVDGVQQEPSCDWCSPVFAQQPYASAG
ncbi:hypothetical protein ACFWIJ_12490 [Streptomyces sp. NPDC127079]|uniref:hypothetical protein n=1 Tax=Streptomyces sp. NPDC127079 TaxID=3347132 RepID=UPI00365C9D70